MNIIINKTLNAVGTVALGAGIIGITLCGLGLVLNNNQLLTELGLVNSIERQTDQAPVAAPFNFGF